MRLNHPYALLGLLLALPVIALYLLKVRRRRVPVSTVLFWNQVFGDDRPRALWQRLRHPLSLLLQLLLLGVLVLALADPEWTGGAVQGRRLVLVLDNSASMQATDLVPHRWDQAQRQARRLIRKMQPDDQLAIIAASDPPRVATSWTNHMRTLLRTVDDLAVCDSPTRLPEAMRLAERLLEGHPQGQVVVVGDGQQSDDLPAAQARQIVWISVASSVDNLAITHWQVRRSPVDPLGVHALVEVCNFSDQQAACRLQISCDDDLLDVIPLDLDPNQVWRTVREYAIDHGGPLLAELDPQDALACDNRAVALVPDSRPQPVTLVTPGNLFLESALRSMPAVELTVTNAIPAQVAENAILICHKVTPETDRLPARLFLIDPREVGDLGTMGNTLEPTLIVRQVSSPTLMSHLELQQVLVFGVRQLELTDGFEVLAEVPGGVPVFAATSQPAQKRLIWNGSLDQGEFPLRTAFPILLSNAIRWFQGDPAPWQEAYSTGSHATIRRDASAIVARAADPETGSPDDFRVVLPDGQIRALAGDTESWTMGPLDQCGVWRIEAKREATSGSAREDQSAVVLAEVACNLASPSESELRVTAPVGRSLPTAGPGGWPPWFYLTLLGLVWTAGEWYLYQRRWIE